MKVYCNPWSVPRGLFLIGIDCRTKNAESWAISYLIDIVGAKTKVKTDLHPFLFVTHMFPVILYLVNYSSTPFVLSPEISFFIFVYQLSRKSLYLSWALELECTNKKITAHLFFLQVSPTNYFRSEKLDIVLTLFGHSTTLVTSSRS